MPTLDNTQVKTSQTEVLGLVETMVVAALVVDQTVHATTGATIGIMTTSHMIGTDTTINEEVDVIGVGVVSGTGSQETEVEVAIGIGSEIGDSQRKIDLH